VPLAIRVVLTAFGLVVAVYAGASLTGNWLSTPPWWERYETATEMRDWYVRRGEPLTDENGDEYRLGYPQLVSRDGREWISGGVVALGLALVLVGAWPRRGKAEAR
jgi:hypothetical protein